MFFGKLDYSAVGFLNQAAVVQRVDSAIHWISQLVFLVFIRWIAIYPVDSDLSGG